MSSSKQSLAVDNWDHCLNITINGYLTINKQIPSVTSYALYKKCGKAAISGLVQKCQSNTDIRQQKSQIYAVLFAILLRSVFAGASCNNAHCRKVSDIRRTKSQT